MMFKKAPESWVLFYCLKYIDKKSDHENIPNIMNL